MPFRIVQQGAALQPGHVLGPDRVPLLVRRGHVVRVEHSNGRVVEYCFDPAPPIAAINAMLAATDAEFYPAGRPL